MFKYTYMLIRYTHDPIREESVNIGLLFYVPELNLVRFSSRDNINALKNVFVDIKLNSLKRYLRALESSFENLAKDIKEKEKQLPLDIFDIKKAAQNVLPIDASSVQWGKEGSGITDDHCKIFDYLNDRFVQQKFSKKKYNTRSDEKIWGEFSKELENRNLLVFFEPRTLNIGGFEDSYQHTYKNGKIHCLNPISFDISDQDEIKNKMLKEVGRIEVAMRHNTDVVFYCLLGKPQNSELLNAFDKAKAELKEIGAKIFIEDKPAELPDYLIKNVDFHEAA